MGLDVGEIGMGLDLGLDLKLFAARSLGRLAAAAAEEKEEEAMDACIRSLEEERGKIEMFKRELPLCVRLLADVIEVMKEEAEKKKKVDRDEEAKMEDGDKRKWMSTAQLWVDNRKDYCGVAHSEKLEKETTSPVSKANSGSFLQFKAVGSGAPSFLAPCFRREDPVLPSLAIKSSPQPDPAAATDECQIVKSSFAGTAEPSSSPVLGLQPQTHQQQQQVRKARRCWSPELHQQFVAALHQLGGPQVATPKQIREVMKVDGLTNDEVKSHLQKYRLHNRRAHGSAVNQQIVLVGGLWVPREQSSSQSGSPQAPLQLSGSSVAVSAATTGDSCEEDDKSESYGRK